MGVIQRINKQSNPQENLIFIPNFDIFIYSYSLKGLNWSIINNTSSARRQKGLTSYCFKYVDGPFCLRTDNM